MNKITETLENIKKTAKIMPKPRSAKNLMIGETARQGDVYITRIDSIPNGLKKIESRQIADGSSKGSRHIVSDNCVIFDNPEKNIFSGNYIDATKEGFNLTHPEHAWICDFPKGFYEINYQIDFNRQQRVRD